MTQQAATGSDACCVGDLISVLKRETYKNRSLARRARRRAEIARERGGDDPYASYCDRLAVAYDAAAAAFESELSKALLVSASMRRADAIEGREAKP